MEGAEDEVSTLHFRDTLQQLESLIGFLLCTKCEKLPRGKVWTLGCCRHKYCETCAQKLCGQPCLACHKKGYPKDAKSDLFSSAILSEIPAVYMAMARLDELSRNAKGQVEEDKERCQKNVMNDELDVDPFEFTEDNGAAENFQATPKGPVSQEFPEVMEETPQHKVTSRPSLKCLAQACNLTVSAARTLAFPSQEAGRTEKGVLVENCRPKTPSPSKNVNSDEELFQSPKVVSDSKRISKSPAGVLLPVLTQYESSTLNQESENKKKPNAARKRSSKGSRNSSELEPPKLTPHKVDPKSVTLDETAPSAIGKGEKNSRVCSTASVKRPTRASKCKVLQEEEVLTKKVNDAKKGRQIIINIPVKSKPLTERKRRISSTSMASSGRESGNSHHPIEKRNAKGETALHIACRTGQLDKVKSLLEAGAEVNARDNAGWTPIHEAINGKSCNKAAVLRVLCEKGGDVNALGGLEDETPLHGAAQLGLQNLVEVLLEFNASPNVRNGEGKLPKEVAFNELIVKMLEERTNAVVGTTDRDHVNLNNSTFTSTTSMVEEDPAVLNVMLKKALLYFNYDVDPAVVTATKEKLCLKVSDKLTPKVTHIVHHFASHAERSSSRVPLSFEYLFAVTHCIWQVSSDWITKSLKVGTCQIPTSYEILGYAECEDDDMVPSLTRINRENGHPNLLDGFCFYLYKTCGFSSPHFQLNKKQLTELIIGAGGKITNREPDPDSIANDIANAAPKFHVINNSRGTDSDYNTEKFAITSHIILYDDKGAPPDSKRFALEHVKTLNSRWVIDSLLHFKLEDPASYM